MEIKEIISKMTLEDKVALGSGKDFWHLKSYEEYGIPEITVSDGPHGLRKQRDETDMLGLYNSVPATCFPTASLSACSFNEELLEEVGEALGKEALTNDVSVILGPGANIKRNPLCGRNFEYYSEDPVLSGKMAAAQIRGIEKTGCGSSLKHFALNNQETMRFSSNSIVDEKTMREIYLKSFEIAVKEGKPSTVMSSYNLINGVHSSDNRWLLNDVLRQQWRFDGMVMTDWGGMYDRIEGFKAGCDLTMPGGSAYMEKECVQAVKEGTLDEKYIDDSAERILKLIFRNHKDVKADMDAHYQLAYKAAADSFVLLKNEDGILPLDRKEKILFVGKMTEDMRYQGAGSSRINPYLLKHPLEFIENYDYLPGCDENGDTSKELLDQLKVAENYDKVVVFAGLVNKDESEGFDREHMKMSFGHLKMIKEVCRYNRNVIVVLISGSALELPFYDEIKGMIYAGLSGEAGAQALIDTLFGENNPSGHLAETWPLHYEDCVSSDTYGNKNPVYKEGIYVGYRYYQKAGKKVRFPFGYGLSYTGFSLSDLRIKDKQIMCTVTNTGKRKGKTVVQLYIRNDSNNCYREVRSLKHFAKIELESNQKTDVSFDLGDEDFMLFDKEWIKAKGEYKIELGFSCEDIRLEETISIDGRDYKPEVPDWYKRPDGCPTDSDYEQVLGHKIEEEKLIRGRFTMNNSVAELKDHSLIMKIMYKAVEKTIAKGFGGKADYSDPNFRMMMNAAAGSSLNAMKISGGMNNYVLEGMLEMANGHFFKGILLMIKQ